MVKTSLSSIIMAFFAVLLPAACHLPHATAATRSKMRRHALVRRLCSTSPGVHRPRVPNVVPAVDMNDFHYHLPHENIAIYPASPRGNSRLLVVQKHLKGLSVGDSMFGSLAEHLPANAHLVFNESRVFEARVSAVESPPVVASSSSSSSSSATKPFEVLFLNPEAPTSDPSAALAAPFHGQTWRCMVRKHYTAPGAVLHFVARIGTRTLDVRAEVVKIHSEWVEEDEENGVEADVLLTSTDAHRVATPLADVLAACGEIPIPPYLNRAAEADDAHAYQNVFSSPEAAGSVAAPTAGLHFTQPLLAQLRGGGVRCSTLVLHVSAATFRPVVARYIAAHDMHAERFEVSRQQLEDVVASLEAGRAITPVGTTSCRLLESLYWLGVKRLRQGASAAPSASPFLSLLQWEAYELGADSGALPYPPATAFRRLLQDASAPAAAGKLFGATSLCIVPGYRFAVAKALVTNFHQPDSTLLLLVAAFLDDPKGRRLKDVYGHAIRERYRFLSYGDACLFS